MLDRRARRGGGSWSERAEESGAAVPEQLSRAVWEVTSDFVLVTDAERRLVYANPAARDRLGLPTDLTDARVLLEDLYVASSRSRLRDLLSPA